MHRCKHNIVNMISVILLDFSPVLLLCFLVQSAEEKVPVWYIMDEFGSQVQHSDQPSCAVAPFFFIQGQLAYSVIWPLGDLQEGGESRHTITQKVIRRNET